MENLLAMIQREKLVLISRGAPLDVLLNAAEICADAGVTLLESTYDHTQKDSIRENAEKIAALVKKMNGRMRIGAGTVLTPDEAKAAFDAGAEYIISPNTDDEVVEATKKLGILSIPGAMTPSEIARAYKIGADMVKVFPADNLGALFFRNMRGPLGHIPLMATGGVNTENIPELLKAGVKAVGVGSTVLRKDLLQNEDYDAIRELAKAHVKAIRTASEK